MCTYKRGCRKVRKGKTDVLQETFSYTFMDRVHALAGTIDGNTTGRLPIWLVFIAIKCRYVDRHVRCEARRKLFLDIPLPRSHLRTDF